MSQFERVVKVARGRAWRTLRDLESLCYAKCGVRDTQPAISARLREGDKINAAGLKRETKIVGTGFDRVWFYRLVKL